MKKLPYEEWNDELAGVADPWERAVQYGWRALAVIVAVAAVCALVTRI